MRRTHRIITLVISTAATTIALANCSSLETTPPFQPSPTAPPPPPPPPPLSPSPPPPVEYREGEIVQSLPADYRSGGEDITQPESANQGRRISFPFNQLANDGNGRIYCRKAQAWMTPIQCRNFEDETPASSGDSEANFTGTQPIRCELTSDKFRGTFAFDTEAFVCADFKRQVSNLEDGNYAIELKQSMFWQSSQSVILRLGSEEFSDVVQPDTNSDDANPPIAGRIAISRFMFAEIKDLSSSFTIGTASPRVQDLSQNPVPNWAWDLKANKLGKHKLEIRIGFQLRSADGERERSFPLENKEITVSPTFIQRVGLFFSGLAKIISSPREAIDELIALLALLGVLGAAYWAMRRDWRRPNGRT